MKKAMLLSIVFMFAAVLIISCSKTDSPGGNNHTVDCSAGPKSFATDVNPLIQTFCNQANCHAPNSVNGPGPLTNFTEVFNARAQIRAQVLAGLMPQNTTLTAAQKNTIICWIDSGAPNN
jgi:hypothetical protein